LLSALDCGAAEFTVPEAELANSQGSRYRRG
jgi:hypothetical protein